MAENFGKQVKIYYTNNKQTTSVTGIDASSYILFNGGSNHIYTHGKDFAADPSHTHKFLELSDVKDTFSKPADTTNTWVLVDVDGKIYHREIPAAYNQDPSTLSVNSANTANIANIANSLYATCATNDYIGIKGGGSNDNGYLEIYTGDNGNEPIYLRQYSYDSSVAIHSATLLDSNGNTSFPGTISSNGHTVLTNSIDPIISVACTSSGILTFTSNNNNKYEFNFNHTHDLSQLTGKIKVECLPDAALKDTTYSYSVTQSATNNNENPYLTLTPSNSGTVSNIQLAGGSNVTITRDSASKIIISSSWRPLGTGSNDAAAGNHNHDFLVVARNGVNTSTHLKNNANNFAGKTNVFYADELVAGSVNAPNSGWNYILSMNGDDSNYAGQIALGMTVDGMWFRNKHIEWTEWKKVAITSDIPTKVSQLTNDAGYLTQHQSLAAYATTDWVNKTFLPLTGGTVNGEVAANSFLINTVSGIRFKDNILGGGGDTAFIKILGTGEDQQLTIGVTNDAGDIVNITTPTATGFKHNGNVVWDSANDGGGSGLDADLLDGVHLNDIFTNLANNGNNVQLTIGGVTKELTINYVNNADTIDGAHLSDIKNWSDRTASAYWKAGWYKVASAQTGTNTEAFLTLDVNEVQSNGHATLFIRKRADSNPYFICTYNNNLNLADFRLYYNGMSMVLYARVSYDWNGKVFRIISEGREGQYDHIWTLYSNMSSTDPNAISAEGENPYINPTYSGRVDWSNSSDKATCLQTSRTLWGIPFDGTANVSGSLSNTGTITASAAATYDIGSNSLDYRYGYFQWIGAKSNTNLRLAANNSDNQIVLHTNGNVGIGTNNPQYKLDVVGTIYTNSVFEGPYARLSNQNGSLIIGDSDNARISAIGDQVIFNTGNAIRFGATDWDWNKWAGLKYVHDSKTIYLGIADGSIFNANQAQSGGTIKFPGISTIEANSFRKSGGSSSQFLKADGSVDNTNYLPLSGGTMNGDAVISFADSNNWSNGNNGVTFPIVRGGLYWSGQSDWISLKSVETTIDNLDLVLQFGDDNSNGLSIKNASGIQVARINADGTNYASGFVKSGSSDDWILMGGGGHKRLYYKNDITDPTSDDGAITPLAVNNWTSNTFSKLGHTHSWTSITDKLVASNEFNIVNSGFNGEFWFNYLPINDRSTRAAISVYNFGNGASGLTSIRASNFIGQLIGTAVYATSAGNADTVDGLHATDGRTFNGNINWSPNWNDAWSDGTHSHPWYGFDHRYENTGAYSTTISDFYGMTIKTACTLRLDFGTLLLNGTDIHSINADTVDGFHADDFVKALGTSNDNIDKDWGQSFKTFDPIPSGTPPEQNPNISLLSIGDKFNRRKQLAFMYNNDNIYYRRHIDEGFTSWRNIAFVDSNVASATKLQTQRTIWGQSFDGTNNVTGLITLDSGSHTGIKISNTYIDAIDQALIIHNNSGGIRFGDDAWDWNQWAGLKYDYSSKTIYLGIADGSVFTANSAQSGGTIKFPGVSTIEASSINIKASNFIGHLSGTADNADKLDNIDGYMYLKGGVFSGDPNTDYGIRSGIKSAIINVHAPAGDTGTWYHIINMAHRNGDDDGADYIGQIAVGMTNYKNSMWLRGSRTDAWTQVITSANIGSQSVSKAANADNATNADTAIKLKDYNGSNNIYCGYAGAGLNSDNIGYMVGMQPTGNGIYYKDVNKVELQKWLGLGARAYDSTNYVQALGTSNDNIDIDWGQSFKTFDPIPSGTPPEQNSNISLLSIGDNFNRRKQLAFIYDNDNIYYRRHIDGEFTSWRNIAFVDSNVASATKLQTQRTIWGQSFDGTSNVSGNMTGVGDIIMSASETHIGAGGSYSDPRNGQRANFKFGGTLCATKLYAQDAQFNGDIMANGNIITQDAQFNGDIMANGNIIAHAATFNNDVSAQSVELSFSTPFIDFHYQNSTKDYTSRIIQDNENWLTIRPNLYVDKQLQAQNGKFFTDDNGAYWTSDIRKKHDFSDITKDIVDKFFEKNYFKHFKWNDTNHDSWGVAAQEFEEWAPEAINTNEDGFKSANYDVAEAKAIAAMTYKIKEQQSVISELKEKLEKLENTLNKLI